jgi:CCR4-NOT transcription complex subunit 7/8
MSFIKEVWADGLEEAFEEVRELVETHGWVGMDTEFPGVVARPIGSFKSTSDYHYQTLRCNVDMLKMIQLGLTFSDRNGTYPNGTITFQFNFYFDLEKHMYAEDSIKLLERSGLDFARHKKHGIMAQDFGELLVTSGLVLFRDVHWISFHSAYDFAYLLKLITRRYVFHGQESEEKREKKHRQKKNRPRKKVEKKLKKKN